MICSLHDDLELLTALPGRPALDQIIVHLDPGDCALAGAAEHIDGLIERPHVALAVDQPVGCRGPLRGVAP